MPERSAPGTPPAPPGPPIGRMREPRNPFVSGKFQRTVHRPFVDGAGGRRCWDWSSHYRWGLLCARHPRWYPPVLALASVLYSIPSLAFFVLLISFTGISRTTVVIPLAVYTLAVLVPNVVDGLRSVPESVRQSATAMGVLTDPPVADGGSAHRITDGAGRPARRDGREHQHGQRRCAHRHGGGVRIAVHRRGPARPAGPRDHRHPRDRRHGAGRGRGAAGGVQWLATPWLRRTRSGRTR